MLVKALILTLPLALVMAASSATWVSVDVQEKKLDGHHIFVIAPLALAQMGLGFVPDEIARVEIPNLSMAREPLARLLADLEQEPRATLAEIVDGANRVTIEKKLDAIELDVRSREDHVEARIPLNVVARLLENSSGDTIEISEAVRALRRDPGGARVWVNSEGSEVEVRLR